jgi:hypothetical protein
MKPIFFKSGEHMMASETKEEILGLIDKAYKKDQCN